MTARILLAHSTPSAMRPLVYALEREGYQVDSLRGGTEILTLAPKADLIVLDTDLPGSADLDGIQVTRRIRADGHNMPILMLTDRDGEADIVMGLDAGANDYVTMPFGLAELLARVRVQLRRVLGGGQVAVQGVRIDAAARKAWLGDKPLNLTLKEFDLLWALMREAGKVVTRDQIMPEVWGSPWYSSAKTVDMHMSWLRRKLGDDPIGPRYITTIRGIGFRFETGQ
jgi:DNA-binding response OmpR family regulator